MCEADLSALTPLVVVVGGIAAAVVGDVDLVRDVLAGAGIGALVGNLVVLRRARQGIEGREPQILAVWSCLIAVVVLLGLLVREVL